MKEAMLHNVDRNACLALTTENWLKYTERSTKCIFIPFWLQLRRDTFYEPVSSYYASISFLIQQLYF